jgi:hypothetical protein
VYWEAGLHARRPPRPAAALRVQGDTVLAECCSRGTRADGSTFARAGMTVQGMVGLRIGRQRLYMEPLQGDPDTVGSGVVQEMGRRTRDRRPGDGER